MAQTAGLPITTIVPFSALPSCATACGHLYDANGACVPPAAPTGDSVQYASCFCNNAQIAAFSTGTAGVCDDACTAPGDSGGLQSIHGWFSSYCSVNQKAVATETKTTSTGKSTATSTSGSDSSGPTTNPNQTWIAGHYQWVIFIVVMVVGITSLWVGACVWHRRFTRRKDRQYALANIRASTGAASGTSGLNDMGHQDHDRDLDGPHDAAGVFAPGNESVFETEKRRSGFLGRRR